MTSLRLNGLAAFWAVLAHVALVLSADAYDIVEWDDASRICPPAKGEERNKIILTSLGLTFPEVRAKFKEIVMGLGASETVPTVVTFWFDAKGAYDPDAIVSIAESEKYLLREAAPGKVEFHDLWLHDDNFDPVAAEAMIAKSHVFYASGGNTYMQLAAARARNDFFEGVIMKRLRAGLMLWTSRSAGSIVPGREIGISPDPRPSESDWWYNGGSHRGLGIVNCILRPHYVPAWFDNLIADYRRNVILDSSCPHCAIVRFTDYGEAVYWAGDGSDAQAVLGKSSKPEPLLIGAMPTRRSYTVWVWIAVSLAFIAVSILVGVAVCSRRSKTIPCVPLPDPGSMELGIASGTGCSQDEGGQRSAPPELQPSGFVNDSNSVHG